MSSDIQSRLAALNSINTIGEHSGLSDSELLREIDSLRTKINSPGETVFMRMLHELKLYQIEIELQNRELRLTHNALEDVRKRYTDVYDFSPLAYLSFDAHGNILDLNYAAAEMLGMDRQSLANENFIQFMVHFEREKFLCYLRSSLAGSAMPNVEFDLMLSNGKSIKIKAINAVACVQDGKASACRMAFLDITETSMTQFKLRLTSKVLENTQEGIMLVDAQNRIITVNQAFLKNTGYESGELIGYSPSLLKSGRHEDNFYSEMYRSLKESDSWQGEIWNRRKNGEVYKEWVNLKVIRNSEGQVDCYIGIYSDIYNHEEMKLKLQELAYYDELTGLANRSLLYDRLHQALVQSKRNDTGLAVLFLDLDNFKEVNDTYGHAAGDYLLKEVSARLTYCLREGDTLSRLGGDEFVVVLPDIDGENIPAIISERMVKSLEAPFYLDGNSFKVSVSVGISIAPRDGEEVTILLKNSDTAMYCVKAQGGNNYMNYTPGMRKGAA